MPCDPRCYERSGYRLRDFQGRAAWRRSRSFSKKKNCYPPHLMKMLRHATLRRKSGEPAGPEHSHIYLALPFVDDTLCRRVEGIIRLSHLNVQVTSTAGPNLRQKLVRSGHLPVPCPGGGRQCNCCETGLRRKCHTKNVICRLDCNLCSKDESFYIGETRRSVRLSYNQHIRDAKNRKTPHLAPIRQNMLMCS